MSRTVTMEVPITIQGDESPWKTGYSISDMHVTVVDDNGDEVGVIRANIGCSMNLRAGDVRAFVHTRDMWNAFCEAVDKDHLRVLRDEVENDE